VAKVAIADHYRRTCPSHFPGVFGQQAKRDPPLPLDEIIRSSANMHMIPADPRVAAQLHGIRRNDRVRIDGWLVRIDADDGWRWTSSLRRDDSGGGACELVYVCEIASQ
jgi:hypothetical protein